MNKTRNIKLFLTLVALSFILLAGCGSPTPNRITETTTAGDIKIAVDEAYQLLFDTEIFTFQSLYKYAKITPLYRPEGDAINLFLNDSVRVVVTSRKLTAEEEEYLKSNKYFPRTEKICYDALAFIINKENEDSLFLYDYIKDIFTGKINKWKDINPKSPLGELIVVFDNTLSSNTRYIKQTFNLKNEFPSNCFAVKTNPDVLEYVQKNKNAIGIISVNWISDKDDSISHRFLSNVKVVSVGAEGDTDGSGSFCRPMVGNIAEGSYPFTREVYMINRETFTGLGTGFVSFVSHDQGQRIILKSGLVPATMPIRLVEIKTQ